MKEQKTIRIGTSGFSYEDWKGPFYPGTLAKKDMLSYYCMYFKTVELNSTYYVLPSVTAVEKLAIRTPDDFEFVIKLHQEITHRRQEPWTVLTNLQQALSPLLQSGKGRALLAQFPYSFKNNLANRKYLLTVRENLTNFPLFVEFRHNSWNKPAVFEFLTSHDIGYVNVDEPSLPGLLPMQSIVTNSLGYVRFHGRNAQKWWQGQGSERYDYLYSEQELRQWVEHIRQIMRQTAKAYIFFNNHPRGQAIKNAMQFREMLTAQTKLLIE